MPRLGRSIRLDLLVLVALSALPVPLFSAVQAAVPQGAVPVRLVQSGPMAWRLERDGRELRVHGAGGEGPLALLGKLGGNSGRLWGVDGKTRQRLDEAHRNGLTMAVGLWLEHERTGFSYDDPEQTEAQLQKCLAAVRELRDHPAVLLWGIGNEMEGAEGDRPAIWIHVNQIATAIHELDPHHPVMTVVAEIGGEKVRAIHQHCPEVDLIGINSYGGVTSLAERYRNSGGTKPYLVTEFGPNGPWEVGRNAFDALEEPTSTEKAIDYRRKLEAIESDRDLCLGSWAFLWGNKQEATSTWFGLLLPDHSRTAAVDELSRIWSGKEPANRCPVIDRLQWSGPNEVDPGSELTAALTVTDPEGEPLRVEWRLQAEAERYLTQGDFQAEPPLQADAVIKQDDASATVRAPAKPGVYRLYATARDGNGGAAVGNLPLRVRGPSGTVPAAPLPCVVYDDDAPAIWHPTGWMGQTDSLRLDPECTDLPKTGKTCLLVEYSSPAAWAGVAWQDPPNDWGEKEGGRDLRKSKKLTFWARGGAGGEKFRVGTGLLGREKAFPDSGKRESPELTLGTEWKQYTIELDEVDLSCIKTGFFFTLAGQGKPIRFYLDAIVIE